MSSSRLGRSNSELQTSRNIRYNNNKDKCPEEASRAWSHSQLPPTHHPKTQRKVAVLYYLSLNGQLQHPHFIEVPISNDSLYLPDFINRLISLRGRAMPSMYSWSSKRSYKNGFVWQDLCEDDIIHPAQGQEYILKGSELLEPPTLATLTSPSNLLSETHNPGAGIEFPAITRRRNQSWSAIDLHEYKVYKSDTINKSSTSAGADASTQTDETRRRRQHTEKSTEINRDEISPLSPPPSDSSPETLESLMKAAGKITKMAGEKRIDLTANNHPSGRMKASTVLMQLLTCGSIGFKDCGPGREHPGLSLMGPYKSRVPRGGLDKEVDAEINNNNNIKKGKMRVEDKEYFSGSIIQEETNKDVFPALKRSSSYNADRMEVKDKEEVVKCIPNETSYIS